MAQTHKIMARFEVPGQRIAYIDGYGNLKTTIPRHARSMAPGTVVRMRIGPAEQEAVVSDGSFAVAPGQLALAPSSSGWPHPHGGETRWLELFLRGGNAWKVFARPRVGARLELIAGPASAYSDATKVSCPKGTKTYEKGAGLRCPPRRGDNASILGWL